jgi:hypothetical protein
VRSAIGRALARPGVGGWTLAAVVTALTWRIVRYALVFPVWGDEAMLAVNFHDRGFAALLDPLDYSQVAPPGFLWLELGARQLLGFTEPALRVVPLLAGLAAVLLFWKLARTLLDRRSALLSVAVLAASFYPMRYAVEIKPYSMDLLVATGLLLAAWSIRQRPASAWRWIVFTTLGAIGAWLSYPSVFVSGGACLWLFLARPSEGAERRWVTALAAGVVITASFAAMYGLAGIGQRTAAPADYWNAGFPPISEPWKIPLWVLDVHTGMMMAYPNGGHSGGSALSFLLAVGGGVALWRARRPALLLLLSPLPLMFLAAALRAYPYGASARVAQHVAPTACLLIGAGLWCALRRGLGARRAASVLPAVTLVFLAVPVAGIGVDIARPYHSRADAEVRELVREAAPDSGDREAWIVWASKKPDGRAPLYSRFVGMGGRVHFQLLRYAPGPLLWAPSVDSMVVLARDRPIRLIAYGNRVFEPDSNPRGAYLRRLEDSLSRSAHARRYDLPDGEWIEFNLLEPASRGGNRAVTPE